MIKQEHLDQFKSLREQIYIELPASTHTIAQIDSEWVTMRDGVQLKTRVYFPSNEASCPVILIRNPYAYLFVMFEALASIFVEHGYILIIQDCRGTGASQGAWKPFFNERNDGLDTLQWIINQQWQDGNIGMYGMSYSSFAQWAIADELPKEVKTLVLDAFGTQRYEQIYMNGMFRHDMFTSWAFFNSGVATSSDPSDLYQKALSIRPHIDADKQVLHTEMEFYREIITHVNKDSEYWNKGVWADLRHVPEKVNVPLLLIDGWFDHTLDGLVQGYSNLREDIKRQSRLILGPWDHNKNSPGELNYANANLIGTWSLKAALQWFEQHLKGKNVKNKVGVIEAYSIGKGTWEEYEVWPPKVKQEIMYLEKGSQGLEAGSITTGKPTQEEELKYTYDPEHYITTHGGSALFEWISPKNYGIKHGARLQESPGKRADILTFLSEPLTEDKEIIGNVVFCLNVSTTAHDTAFAVKLMEVFPDGRAFNICDGISSLVYRNRTDHPLTYTPNEMVQLEIECWPISWNVKQGSRLRIDISSSNFPAYHNHLNQSGIWSLQQEAIIAEQTLYTGLIHASYIQLPVIDQS